MNGHDGILDLVHATSKRTEPRHPIRVAAERSGLTPDTLRAWERRYEVVRPDRSDTARRLYSDADIDRLRTLQQLAGRGHSIGSIARLAPDELQALLAADPDGDPEARATAAAHPALPRAVEAMVAMDAPALRRILSRAALELGPAQLFDRVIDPFCSIIGERWASGAITTAHEHVVSVAMRSTLGGMLEALTADADGPRILATTPAGERHELGALMAGIAAAAAGWRVHYLGPDLPAADIAAASRHLGTDVVLLSIAAEHGRELQQELIELRHALGEGATIIAGGSGAGYVARTLREIRAHVHGLASMRRALTVLQVEVRT